MPSLAWAVLREYSVGICVVLITLGIGAWLVSESPDQTTQILKAQQAQIEELKMELNRCRRSP